MKCIKKSLLILGAIISLYSLSCSRNNFPSYAAESLPNTVVLKWNEVAFEAFGGSAYQHSLMASRINAMTHIAIHDALNAIQPKYAGYAFNGKDAGADPIAAAAVAAYTVLLHEIPDKKNFLDSALSQSLSAIPPGDARNRGMQLGKQAAQAIINDRADDGSAGELVKQIPPSTTPGVYQPVPPFNIIFVPHWENVNYLGLKERTNSVRHLIQHSIVTNTRRLLSR